MIANELQCDACGRRTPLNRTQGWGQVVMAAPSIVPKDVCPGCLAKAFGWKQIPGVANAGPLPPLRRRMVEVHHEGAAL